MLKQCAFHPLLRSQTAYNEQPCRRTSRQGQENRKQPTRENQIKLESRHTLRRKGRMMNHLSPTCLSPRSCSVIFQMIHEAVLLFPSENYTSIYMSLNIKRHIYVSYTTNDLLNKIKRHKFFLIRHVFFFEVKHVIVLYNI